MNRRRASLRAVVATLVTNMLDSSSSSSSSSDSEEELILHELVTSAHNPKKRKRKLGDYIEKALFEYSDEEFFQDFRIRRSTVAALIERYARSSSYVPHFDHGGYPQKSPEEHILSFLWYATNKVCIKDVAIRFNISDSTVHGIIERLLEYLCSLLPKEIRFPQDLDEVVKGFQQLAGFPGVVGSIGGTCINTRSPAHVRAAGSRQDVASVALQAVCDPTGRFLDVFVGPPGDLEAESVFLASPLAEELPHWCQDGHHLVGGPEFPLREYLLTPFTPPDGSAAHEAAFNERHERARVPIDRAFALLKGRFRQLHFLEFVTANKMRRFIMACCVLHNLCVRAGDVQLGTAAAELPDSGEGRLIVCAGQSEAEEEDERALGSARRDQLALGFVQG